ncbi:hypothetical protein ACFX1Q_009695 [Malus domestica]
MSSALAPGHGGINGNTVTLNDKEKVKAFVSVSSQKQNQKTEKSNLSKKIKPTSELSVPADDLVNLEWLSHFVEDSFPSCQVHTRESHVREETRPRNHFPKTTLFQDSGSGKG